MSIINETERIVIKIIVDFQFNSHLIVDDLFIVYLFIKGVMLLLVIRLMFIFLFIILTSCDKNSKEVKFKYPRLIKQMEMISDSSYFTKQVSHIEFHDDNIYVLDNGAYRILSLDANTLELNNVIGGAGSGPGQFRDNVRFNIHNRKLYLLDAPLQRMSVFDLNGNLLSTNRIEFMFIDTRFFVDENLLFASFSSSKYYKQGIIGIFDFVEGKLIKPFAHYLKSDESIKGIDLKTKDLRFVHNYLGNVISFTKGETIVSAHDRNGKLISKKDFSNDYDFYIDAKIYRKKRYKNAINMKKVSSLDKITIETIADSYLFGDKLYVLSYAFLNEKFSMNKIVVFDLSNLKDIVISDILVLKENGLYRTFAVAEGTIAAYNFRDFTFEIYKIKEVE